MIDAVGTDKVIDWRSERGREKFHLIALPDFSYVVVIAQRTGYLLLWTAYCVERAHRRKKLEKEWERYLKS